MKNLKEFFEDLFTVTMMFLGSIILLFLLGTIDCKAQSFVREGKVLVSNNTSRATKDTIQTDLQWKDSKDNYYPIILNKSNGRCYIWKISSKTGKYYKFYLKEDACRNVCKEYNIAYIEKQTKN